MPWRSRSSSTTSLFVRSEWSSTELNKNWLKVLPKIGELRLKTRLAASLVETTYETGGRYRQGANNLQFLQENSSGELAQKLAMAMPRLDGQGITPFAFLFPENEGQKPLIVSYTNGCFTILDTRTEQWQWHAKTAGNWGTFFDIVDGPDADPEWANFHEVTSAALFSLKAREVSNGMAALTNRMNKRSSETRKLMNNTPINKRRKSDE